MVDVLSIEDAMVAVPIQTKAVALATMEVILLQIHFLLLTNVWYLMFAIVKAI